MSVRVDLIVYGAGQLLTLAGSGPCSGQAMGNLGIIKDGAIAIADGRIIATGTSSEIRRGYHASREWDAAGRVVLPGFVDAHTHLVFAGSRQDEFERRIAGATYLEIMAAGGGIMSTVRATRAASVEQLVAEAQPRLARMLAHGTTTAEVKTGYGLTTADELKCLEAIHLLNSSQPVELVPTFLGAHALPGEYEDRAEAYVDLVIDEMLPAVRQKYQSTSRPLPFCDVFCDEGAFDLQQTERILKAAKALGMPLKVHADEFAHLGAARLAVALGAVSADHLLRTPPEEIAAMSDAGVIAVLLPGTPFGLGQHEYADARAMIAAGLPVALGTDLNPGTCYCESMPFMMALACRFMKMTPAEAIVASTVNAAYAIGLGSELGRLQPGFAADLVILDVDDYRHLAYRFGTNLIQTVIKRGNVVFTA
ncbi:MAG: imidazolonepropionase [Chloroflexi bacterium]|nr:imidazolonepropionase [Chloroflexota bacterium]